MTTDTTHSDELQERRFNILMEKLSRVKVRVVCDHTFDLKDLIDIDAVADWWAGQGKTDYTYQELQEELDADRDLWGYLIADEAKKFILTFSKDN